MKDYFKEIFIGGKSLLVGLGVTFKAAISPIVTVQYPREKIDVTPNIRCHIDLVPNPHGGDIQCIACGMCERACPSGCIEVITQKKEGEKGKTLSAFKLDFTKCSLCGICVESCPKDAIYFSNEYELASFSKDDFHFDLLQRLKERK
ncbi:MAG: NADH-quinone oxidoreductase subunit I [Desulfobacterales bacterium]|nr:NADH-quinone oxidoreductase subunit I [Desulfobacterales bacterium]